MVAAPQSEAPPSQDAHEAPVCTDADIVEAEAHGQPPPRKCAKGLLAIGLFKLSKAAFFLIVGLTALHLIHVNLGDLAIRATNFFHLSSAGPIATALEDKADLVSGHQLRQVSLLSILYSCVSLTEGVGLMLEQTWAEYLTLILTICGLPLEVFEIFRKPTAIKFGVLVVNVLVLAYLVWYLRRAGRLGGNAAAAAAH